MAKNTTMNQPLKRQSPKVIPNVKKQVPLKAPKPGQKGGLKNLIQERQKRILDI